MRLYGRWHHLLVVLVVEKTVPFKSESVCKLQFRSEFSNLDPLFTLDIAGLRVDNSKSVILKIWNIAWGERTKLPKFD